LPPGNIAWGGGGGIQGTPNRNPMETNSWGFAKVNSLNREKEALEQSVAQVRVTNGRFFPLRSLAAVKQQLMTKKPLEVSILTTDPTPLKPTFLM